MTGPASPEDPNEAAFYRVVRYFLVTPLSRAASPAADTAPQEDEGDDPSRGC